MKYPNFQLAKRKLFTWIAPKKFTLSNKGTMEPQVVTFFVPNTESNVKGSVSPFREKNENGGKLLFLSAV